MRILEWDSAFWGMTVGLADAPDDPRNGCDCAYLLLNASDTDGAHLAASLGWRLVDVRVKYEAPPLHAKRVGIAIDSDLDDLVALARTAFTASRFYADPRFPDEKCAGLYETWIRNSLGGWADDVLVLRHDGRLAGFVTLHADDGARIGLIAVKDSVRGEGIAAQLLAASRAWALSRIERQQTLTVVTQGRNIAAQRAFQKAGFVTSEVGLWFHRWWI